MFAITIAFATIKFTHKSKFRNLFWVVAGVVQCVLVFGLVSNVEKMDAAAVINDCSPGNDLNTQLLNLVQQGDANVANLVEINCANKLLAGTLATDIGLFTNLKTVNLADNTFTGRFPTEIGQLAALITLNIINNKFSGPFPIEIGKIQTLQTLLVDGNLFTGKMPPHNAADTDFAPGSAFPTIKSKLKSNNATLEIAGGVAGSILAFVLVLALGFYVRMRTGKSSGSPKAGASPGAKKMNESPGLNNVAKYFRIKTQKLLDTDSPVAKGPREVDLENGGTVTVELDMLQLPPTKMKKNKKKDKDNKKKKNKRKNKNYDDEGENDEAQPAGNQNFANMAMIEGTRPMPPPAPPGPPAMLPSPFNSNNNIPIPIAVPKPKIDKSEKQLKKPKRKVSDDSGPTIGPPKKANNLNVAPKQRKNSDETAPTLGPPPPPDQNIALKLINQNQDKFNVANANVKPKKKPGLLKKFFTAKVDGDVDANLGKRDAFGRRNQNDPGWFSKIYGSSPISPGPQAKKFPSTAKTCGLL